MIGDQNDIAGRLIALLPQGWFPRGAALSPAYSSDEPVTANGAVLTDVYGNPIDATIYNAAVATTAPVLYSLISGIAQGLSWSYSLIEYALAQVLIGTASSVWLDLHAFDFLGTSLLRRVQEGDASFRTRIRAALFPPANTRAALIARLTQLTGRAPKVFEPTNPADTGAYGYGGLGYGVAGAYGSLALPFQAFVTAFRPLNQGVPLLAGYSGNTLTPVYAPLGYGTGLGSYVDIAQVFDGVTDADIYAAVAAIEPAGSIVWTRITS